MNQGWIYSDYISSKQAGQTVLEFYQRFAHSTREEWIQRIAAGQILLEGRPVSPDTILATNQCLTYARSPWQEPNVPLDLQILYQDQDLWIVHKPSGLPVLPGGKFLENTVLGQLKRRFPQESMVPIHRLGRGTSGLLLLARSHEARRHLSQQMRDRKIFKRYLALVPSGNYPDHFQIQTPIGRIPYPQLGYLYAATPTGKSAQSYCEVLQRQETQTVMAVQITTGRPHQIRIHLAAYGYPLVGDPLYQVGGIPSQIQRNSTSIPSDCGYDLHAWQLKFLHPTQDRWIEIESSPPKRLEIV